MRDWTLQYSLLPAATQEETTDCICPVDWEPYDGECRKISTLPTIQPPAFTPLLLVTKTYAQYSQYGVKFFDPGYDIGGIGTYEVWGDDAIKFWKNTNLQIDEGVMNRTGIWTTTSASNQEIGFASCFNAPTEKTYLIGFGVDNFVSIRVDGVYVMDMESIESANTFRYWNVYPVTIKKGIHVIEIIARNRTSIAAIGAEIYDATKEQLKLVTNETELEPYLIFSTKDLVGEYTNLGTNGYEILADYALVLCDGNPPYYRKIEYMPCICGNELICDCTLSFSSYVENPVSVLDVGTLEGGTCTFDQYVIDWYRDGELALTSGVGGDPDIEAFHPFTGDSAIPVIGGTYVPVLRYVILAGETTKIYKDNALCLDWCDFTDNLPPVIVVSSLDCGITNITGLYQYRLSYNTSEDYSLASRSVRWDLPTDGSIINMALEFTAYSVADKVEVFYNDSETPLMAWILGSNLNSNDYSAMPYKRDWAYYFKFAFGLPAYQTGDYLIIKITPSVLETNFNTEWQLDIKCLTASTVFNCNFLTDEMRTYDIPNTRLDWDATNCRYKLVLKTLAPTPNYMDSGNTDYPFYAYGGLRTFIHSEGHLNGSTQETGLYLDFNKTAVYYYFTLPGYNTYIATTGIVNLAKTGDTLVFTCADIADYNRYKTAYDALILTNFTLTRSSDPINVSHYRWFRFDWRSMPLGCGDTVNSIRNFWIWIDSTFTFNESLKTITIEAIIPTNQIIEEDCNDAYVRINNSITNMVSCLAAYGDFSEDTTCSTAYFDWGQGYNGINVNKVTAYNSAAGLFFYGPYTTPCETNLFGYCMHPTIPSYYAWFMFFGRCEITAAVDENGDFLEDPRENFLVKEMRDPVTLCLAQPWSYVLIYEMKNGVQIFPIP